MGCEDDEGGELETDGLCFMLREDCPSGCGHLLESLLDSRKTPGGAKPSVCVPESPEILLN